MSGASYIFRIYYVWSYNHEIYINKLNSKKINNISTSKKLNINNKTNSNNNIEIKEIIEEIENNSQNNFFEDNNNLNEQILEKNKDFNINESSIIYDNNNNRKLNKWFLNYKNSCYLDSFYTIFIFAVIQKLIKNDKYKQIDFNTSDDLYIKNFNDIIKFSKYLLQQINDDFLIFFELYIKYQSDIDNNFLLLKDDEIGPENSITICYRPFDYIDIFRIKYKRFCECNGKCKYAKGIEEILYTKAYLELTKIYLSEIKITDIKDFITGYFNDRIVSYNEENCIRENNNYRQKCKYQILELPLILSIYSVKYKYS